MAKITNENLGLDSNHLPYMQQKRKYGEGEIRINTSLSFSEDIYALCFVMQVRDEILE